MSLRNGFAGTAMDKPILLIARDYPRMVGGIAHYIARTFSSVPPDKLSVISHGESRGINGSEQEQRFRMILTGGYSAALRSGKLAILPLTLSTIRHVLQDRRYKIVIAEQIQTAIPALIAARILGAKLIIFAYGMEITTSRWRRMKRWMFRQADRVITISAYSRVLLLRLGVAPERIGLVQPSVDRGTFGAIVRTPKHKARKELGLDADAKVLLSVAVLKQKYKGIDTTIRATSLLLERFPRLRYVVVGEGPDRPRLEQLVHDLRLERVVMLVGAVDNETKGLYYAASDLFLLPNRVEYGNGGERSEGFGIVFLEAALFGKPCIGGQGGSLDAVVDGETGLSVSGRSVEEVASAAARLLDNDDLSRRLSEAGRRRAEVEFSPEATALRLHQECFMNDGETQCKELAVSELATE